MKGLGTALVTPFSENGEVDYSALGTLIEHQIAGGTDYLVILGTTSEVPTLTRKEQDDIVSFVVKQVAGRLPLVLGIGGNSTAAVVERITELKDTLVEHFSAILSVTPYYNRPQQEGLYLHFCEVAKASPVPVILYNVPKRTGVNLLPETTRRIYDAHPEKIMGIKEACGSLEQFAETVAVSKGDFAVISLTKGQTVSCGVGCEVMLRIGSAEALGADYPVLVDSTNGDSVSNGSALKSNHLYLVTIAGNGFKATAGTTKLLIRGNYTVN